MKTSIIVIALLASGLSSNSHAQSAGSYAVVTNGANYRVLQKTTVENGTNRVHRVVELATGMYYTNSSGQLVESKEQIETFAKGAIARQGPYQVIFANNLNSAGAIDMQTPDGKRLRSSILGLAYYDTSNGSNVLIAQIQDSQGELISSNQVLYTNAFDGVVKADVRYTYRKGSFEQDVILRTQPPTPESLGLNSQSTEIEVLTEFINPPKASIAANTAKTNALPDEEIGWGVTRIGRGRAFDLGEPRNSRSWVTVRRQYVTAQGRNILVEGVPLRRIEPYLANLPLQASSGDRLPVVASKTLSLPKTPPMQAEPKPIELASASPSSKGFVLDYVEINTDTSDFTFQSGTTYFISGSFSIGGTTTFEGGTVLKFPEDGSGLINCHDYTSGGIVCATTPYSPAVFTSENDDSAGEALPWSSGSPTGWNGDDYLCYDFLDNWQPVPIELDHCRFFYAGTAVETSHDSTFNDCQFVQCFYCVTAGSITVHNSLASWCMWVFDASPTCDNCTFDSCDGICDGTGYFANCIFSSMGNIVSGVGSIGFNTDPYAPPSDPPTYSYDGSNNGFNYNWDPTILFGASQFIDSSAFQSGPLGNYYLSGGNQFLAAGNTTADQAGLYWWTTQTSQAIEGFSVVDLGYHYPAVNGNGTPISTLLPGIPDYISDPAGDGLLDIDVGGLPYWWEWKYFGNFGHSASELDGGGVNTLLYDFQNGLDPNVISFSLFTTNIYANTGLAAVQVSVSAGVPSYQAVLVNNTNFAGASWTGYASSNLTVTLGTTQGEYAVWVGLKGLPDNAAQTWHEIDFTNDTTPPVLVITSPTNTTTGVPLLQVLGYADKQLGALTFDVSNATGVVAGQPGIIMSQYFDTNSWGFTTNYFQCFDIMLVTGMNLVSIHATDFAGNVTTSNLLLNLDFSTRTSPPRVSITFPQDGMAVSGTSFTLDGFVDDPTATIAAQIVDTSGDTNVVSGVVERNGRFWVDNLPLAGGTNQLTLTITDAAGNAAVTNIGVIQSAVALAMTPVDPNLLWQSVVDVTGTISGSGYAVSVNGVAATVNGNSWSATNVPVTPGGVASFTALASASGQAPAATKSSPPKPDTIGLMVWHDEQTIHESDDDLSKKWLYGPGEFLENTNETWTTNVMSQHWDFGYGGAANATNTIDWASGHWDWDSGSWVADDGYPSHSRIAGGWQFPPLDTVPPTPYDCQNATPTGDDLTLNRLGCEVCDVQNNYDTDIWNYDYDNSSGPFWAEQINHHTYTRHAHTVLALLSGGRAIPGRQILHMIIGWVKDITPLYPEAQPPYYFIYHYISTSYGDLPNLPNTSVHLLGDTLHDDPTAPGEGTLYYATPAGADPILFTPTVVGANFYVFGFNNVAPGLNDQPSFESRQVIPNIQPTVNGGGTSPDQPFRFWVNDVGYSGDIISGGDVPGSGHNGSTGQVNGCVDVINFFPVDVHIGAPNIMPPDLIQYRLKGNGLYYTYTDKTSGNERDYLTTDATSRKTGYGDDLTSPVYSAPTHLADGTLDFNATFTNKILQNGGEGVVLMTASTMVDPSSPLELQAYWHGQCIYTTNLYLSISGVEDMYRSVNLRNGYSGIPGEPPNNPDVPDGNMFVFVHGYNVNATQSRGWNAEMFKRLYQAGSHAMFTGIDWQGDDGQWSIDGGVTPNYYKNVVHAFDTAPNLAVAVNNLPGDGKYIAGHSLGNMVVSSAIQDWGLEPAAYFMIDAAVAIEAYSPGAFGSGNLVNPHYWPNYDSRLYASRWNELFASDSSDGRSGLTWRGRFGSVSGINYYSSTEDVLTNADGQLHSIFSSEYAWVTQEMRKGTWLASVVASREAGWGFNSSYNSLLGVHMSPADAALLSDSALQANSFFRKFDDTTLYDPSLGSAEAANTSVREKVLADGIPALSNAAGGPSGGSVGSTPYDMSAHETGWPQARLNSALANRWLHSDIKNIAYPFNHLIFESLAGSLQ